MSHQLGRARTTDFPAAITSRSSRRVNVSAILGRPQPRLARIGRPLEQLEVVLWRHSNQRRSCKVLVPLSAAPESEAINARRDTDLHRCVSRHHSPDRVCRLTVLGRRREVILATVLSRSETGVDRHCHSGAIEFRPFVARVTISPTR